MLANAKRRFGATGLAAVLVAAAAGAHAETAAGPAFDVTVDLSQAAAARLANPKETILVIVEFYGEPKSAKLRDATEGRYDLSPEQKVEMSGAGLARVAGPKYDRAKLRLMENGAINVAITVVSGRRSSPDNLLDCGDFDDKLALAAEKPVAFHCKLIGEK